MRLQAQALRLEQVQLRQELTRLRTLAGDSAPVLLMAADEELEVVLDMAPFMDPRFGRRETLQDIRPAARTEGQARPRR